MSKQVIELEALYPVIEEVISSGGEFRLYPRGTSMMPLIRQGIDSVILVSAGEVAENDIILYKRDNGQFVLHRVVKIKNGEYIMCGDNQNALEHGISRSHILARVAYMYRDNERVNFDTREYQKYLKKCARRRLKGRILGPIKEKLFKK